MTSRTHWILVLVLIASCAASKQSSETRRITIDPRDGQRYPYIRIGNDEWMTENMRYNVPGSKYNPNNPDSTYGRLYTWHQAMEACPKGWELSGHYDWMSIEKLLFDDSLTVDYELLWKHKGFRGQNASWLKAQKGWVPSGIDSLNLSILPAGLYNHLGFKQLGEGAYFWTANTYIQDGVHLMPVAIFRAFYKNEDGISYNKHSKSHRYFSCRCVRYVKEEEEE